MYISPREMKTLLFSNIFVVFLLSLCVGRGEAAFSRSMRCPCHHSLAAERWNSLSIEEAVRLSDVVLLGRVVDLHAGIRGTMNASLISIFTYKGPSSFLSRLEDVTNFAEDTREDLMALFFFAEEPSGNLALQCMSPLLELHSATLGDLKALLDFVRDLGRQGNKENDKFVPPTPDPCSVSSSPSPCAPIGAFCSFTNTLPGHTYKCTCLTGYHGDGYICLLTPTVTPTLLPTDPCGGVSSPLVDLLGNAERCNEGGFPSDECPPLHYCHHGICCPVTPPNSVTPPAPSSPVTPSFSSVVPKATPTAPPPYTTDDDDCGSGEPSSSGCGFSSGSGFTGSGLDDGSGFTGSGLENGSGFGSGLDGGSGFTGSGDPEVVGVARRLPGGSGGWTGEHTAGQSNIEFDLDTFEDDEDMAYGQVRRRRRKRR